MFLYRHTGWSAHCNCLEQLPDLSCTIKSTLTEFILAKVVNCSQSQHVSKVQLLDNACTLPGTSHPELPFSNTLNISSSIPRPRDAARPSCSLANPF